jgi:hypothetical protein
MFMRLKHISRWTPLALCSMLLAALLVACGGTAGSPTSAATAAPTTPPSPTPTPVPMTTLAGNGFTINYPQGWQLSRSGSRLVTLTANSGTIKMTITTIPDPNGAIGADSLVNTAIKAVKVPLKNEQTESVPPTATVGGVSWNQQSVSGTQRLNAADTVIQAVVLATVHPGNTLTSKGYTIMYSAPKSMFSQVNTTGFQPILLSFKFQ